MFFHDVMKVAAHCFCDDVTFIVADDGDPSESDSATITITVNDTLP